MSSSRALKFAAMLLLIIVTGLTTRACRRQTQHAVQPVTQQLALE